MKCIVKKDNKFLVEESNNKPVTFIFPDFGRINFDAEEKYILPDKSIEIIWFRPRLKEDNLLVKHKNQVLETYPTTNIQQVCDFFNKYNSLSKEEIAKLYKEIQDSTKSEMEKAIEKLKLQKKELEGNVLIYIKINQKQEELNELLSQLQNPVEN